MRKKGRKTRSWHASVSSSHPEEETEQIVGEMEDVDTGFGATKVKAASEKKMRLDDSIY